MYALAICLPLIGAVLAGLFGRWLKDTGAQVVTVGAMLLSAVISVFILDDVALGANPQTIELFTWIASGTFEVARAAASTADRGATVIVGGGDSAAATVAAGVVDRITHVSTGGSASPQLLSGQEIPPVPAPSYR